ncbi:MAG: hypothetical protein ACT4PZ_08150 [Panacagrimonas sp.]
MAIQQLNAVEVEAVAGGILNLGNIVVAAVSQLPLGLDGLNITLAFLRATISTLPIVGPRLTSILDSLLA